MRSRRLEFAGRPLSAERALLVSGRGAGRCDEEGDSWRVAGSDRSGCFLVRGGDTATGTSAAERDVLRGALGTPRLRRCTLARSADGRGAGGGRAEPRWLDRDDPLSRPGQRGKGLSYALLSADRSGSEAINVRTGVLDTGEARVRISSPARAQGG